MLGGITCPITNKKIGSETANAIVDWIIFDCNFSSFIILFFVRWTDKAPIPSPKNAIEIAIKA